MTPAADGSSGRTAFVFPVGQISVDLGPADMKGLGFPSPRLDPPGLQALLKQLDRDPSAASSVTWTLEVDSVPLYALEPEGPFAEQGYQRLCGMLRGQIQGIVEQVAAPGRISGTVTLHRGKRIPVIRLADSRMTGWARRELLESFTNRLCCSEETLADAALWRTVNDFLDRISVELRGPGLSARERALNYCLTRVTNEPALDSLLCDGMALDSVLVDQRPFAHTGRDPWDVDLIFFHPRKERLTTRRICRFSVDVVDVCPVMIAGARIWSIR
jgi:hypothetical protein